MQANGAERKVRNGIQLLLGLTMVLFVTVVFHSSAMARSNHPKSIPAFSLKDPADATHAESTFADKAVVFIITVPNVKHGEHQTRWKKWMTKKEWPEGVKLCLIEDLSQAQFKDKALAAMKEKYKPGGTLLLLDHDGEIRKKFLVRQDDTAVLVYNKKGQLVYATSEKPTYEEARKIYKMISKF